MNTVEFKDLSLGDDIMVLENVHGCVTTASGVVTKLTEFNELDLNDALGLEVYDDSLIVLIRKADNAETE
jgi:hypothetical protein